MKPKQLAALTEYERGLEAEVARLTEERDQLREDIRRLIKVLGRLHPTGIGETGKLLAELKERYDA